jgi:MFS family permease
MLSAASISGFVLVGICAIAVGMLFDPLIAEFHWTNAATSGLATAYALAAMLSGPLFGLVIDRAGSRGVMIAGVAMVGLGFCTVAASSTLYALYAAFVLIGIGYGGAYFLGASALIAKQMGNRKDLGMGIWMFAGSAGAAVFALVISQWTATHGWRSTSLACALLVFAMVPVILFLIPATRSAAAYETVPAQRAPIPVRHLVAPGFVLTTLAGAFAAFGMNAVYFHAVPILHKAGFSAQTASSIFGASWILSAVGSLASGALSQRYGAQRVLCISLIVGALGTLALLLAPHAQYYVAAAAVFIVLWGATANAVNQFLPILLVEYFGPMHLGVLLGIQGALWGLVGSLAPIVTGALFDAYSSYAVAIVTSTVATFLAFVLIALLPRKRTADTPRAPQDTDIAVSPSTPA